MEILKNLKVPTGNILIVQGEKGQLECVSLGDYGKEANLKANFMGLTRDIEKVSHQKLLPLSEKWVITLDTKLFLLYCWIRKRRSNTKIYRKSKECIERW